MMATPAMQALISVRSVDEALVAADAGASMIDCKEPRAGALGALPVETIARIVEALRGRAIEISATVGDAPVDVAAAVREAAAAGVDAVKVGVSSLDALRELAALPRCIVPVLLADRGGLDDDALIDFACGRFATAMVDTVGKRDGSVFEVVPMQRLRFVVECARRYGCRVGIAGALRLDDLPRLRELLPDFAGFRSAVCDGDRDSRLDPQRLTTLLSAFLPLPLAGEGADPLAATLRLSARSSPRRRTAARTR